MAGHLQPLAPPRNRLAQLWSHKQRSALINAKTCSRLCTHHCSFARTATECPVQPSQTASQLSCPQQVQWANYQDGVSARHERKQMTNTARQSSGEHLRCISCSRCGFCTSTRLCRATPPSFPLCCGPRVCLRLRPAACQRGARVRAWLAVSLSPRTLLQVHIISTSPKLLPQGLSTSWNPLNCCNPQ